MSWELPDVHAGIRKGRETRDQIANIRWIIERARTLKKEKVYFCFIDYTKAFDCVNHKKLWKILKEMRVPDHLTCLLRNLYTGQEATDRTTRSQLGKEYDKAVYSTLLNLHAQYIMWNARLDESQAEIKIVGRNINNLRYADDT